MTKTKTKQKFTCPECEKELKNAKALAGHLWFAHGKRAGEKASLYDNIKTLEREKGTNPDTIERIEKIEKIVEHIAELVETVLEAQGTLLDLIKKVLQPHNPGNPGDPKPEKVKSDDEEEDNGLPNIFGKDKSDDEEKSKETDDEPKSKKHWTDWFL